MCGDAAEPVVTSNGHSAEEEEMRRLSIVDCNVGGHDETRICFYYVVSSFISSLEGRISRIYFTVYDRSSHYGKLYFSSRLLHFTAQPREPLDRSVGHAVETMEGESPSEG
jgi:hypothetical protein